MFENLCRGVYRVTITWRHFIVLTLSSCSTYTRSPLVSVTNPRFLQLSLRYYVIVLDCIKPQITYTILDYTIHRNYVTSLEHVQWLSQRWRSHKRACFFTVNFGNGECLASLKNHYTSKLALQIYSCFNARLYISGNVCARFDWNFENGVKFLDERRFSRVPYCEFFFFFFLVCFIFLIRDTCWKKYFLCFLVCVCVTFRLIAVRNIRTFESNL